MLGRTMIKEIIDMNLKGYSINEIIKYYKRTSGTVPSRPTIREYYSLDVVPEDFGANLSKNKVFDVEPWKSYIIAVLVNNAGKCYRSSVYDVMIERFIESDEYEELPGSERMLRTYISYLIASGQVEVAEKNRRTYDHVFDTPPGQQMLIDFGELRFGKGFVVHYICLLLR